MPGEVVGNLGSGLQPDPFDPGGDLFRSGFAEPRHRAETLQQSLFADLTDTGDLIQDRIADGAHTQSAVVGDREPVGLIADRLQKFERGPGLVDQDRFRIAGDENFFVALARPITGNGGQRSATRASTA